MSADTWCEYDPEFDPIGGGSGVVGIVDGNGIDVVPSDEHLHHIEEPTAALFLSPASKEIVEARARSSVSCR